MHLGATCERTANARSAFWADDQRDDGELRRQRAPPYMMVPPAMSVTRCVAMISMVLPTSLEPTMSRAIPIGHARVRRLGVRGMFAESDRSRP